MYYTLTLNHCVDSYNPGWITDMADLVEINTDVHFFPDRDSAIAYGEREMNFYRQNCEVKNSQLKFDYQETDDPTDDYHWSRMTVIDPNRNELGGLYAFAEFRVEEVKMEDE